MLKARTLGTVLCLGALTALPACSMFGGGNGSTSAGSSGQYRESSSSSTYSTPSTAQTPQAGTNVTHEAAITPDMIRDVQDQLKHANLYKGQVDGVWGPMTEHGLSEWQQQHNMNATGQLDMATLQAMNISTNNSQYGQNNNSGQSNANQTSYSTAGSHPTGSTYSSNAQDHTTTNTSPASQPGMPSNNNGITGNTQPTH